MSKIQYGSRGIVHLPLGGQDRMIKFRAHEIAILEQRLEKGIMSLLSQETLGINFLKNAIIVGVAHEFIGKKGKARKALTEQEVCRWIDDIEDKEEIPFEDLLEAVMRAVVGGMPGGQKYIDEMDKDDDEGKDQPSPE